MIRPSPPYVLLEDRTAGGGPARLFRSPVEVLRCDEPARLADTLDQLQAGVHRGLHAAGYLAYEAGGGLEPRLKAPGRPEGPVAWFGLFEQIELIGAAEIDDAFAGLPPPPPLRDLKPAWDAQAHADRLAAAKALIGAGDIYQVNLTYPIDFAFDGDPLALYAALRARQPVAHGGVVATGERAILSVSPELFVAAEAGRLTARPMKGTAPRAPGPSDDEAAKAGLRLDPKQRAENLMITDLLRNDLSRICRPGSVRTPALFTVETYPTFHALTSTVSGEMAETARFADVLAALFPCGSIVGAPKIRAAEIIAELEDEPRGVYTGAIGAIAPSGDFAFNVAIRTAVIEADGRGRYGVGGGLVADSDPEVEYAETRLKARVLTDLAQDHQLIETLRWSAGAGFIRRDAHLERLVKSARVLGFVFDAKTLDHALDRAAVSWAGGQDRRARILLSRSGAIEVAGPEIGPEPDRMLEIGLFHTRLDAADPFLRHKTTWRPLHEAAAAAAARAGLDEMLLLNQHGQIADGARNSVFVARDGCLLTPPLRDGALAGVLRQALIEGGEAREAALGPDDLAGHPVFIGNSLRGLRPARLPPG